jgi:hypothetical protein
MQVTWRGVFPAVTTQLRADLSIDVGATQRVVDALIGDGVNGVIALGGHRARHGIRAAAAAAALGRTPRRSHRHGGTRGRDAALTI